MKSDEFERERRAVAQAESARMLASLTDRQIGAKLPIASWHIGAFDTELSGNVTALEFDHDHNIYRDDKTSIENVRAWARFFAVEPEYKQWQTAPEWGETFITVNELGITITIWACITTNQK